MPCRNSLLTAPVFLSNAVVWRIKLQGLACGASKRLSKRDSAAQGKISHHSPFAFIPLLRR